MSLQQQPTISPDKEKFEIMINKLQELEQRNAVLQSKLLYEQNNNSFLDSYIQSLLDESALNEECTKRDKEQMQNELNGLKVDIVRLEGEIGLLEAREKIQEVVYKQMADKAKRKLMRLLVRNKSLENELYEKSCTIEELTSQLTYSRIFSDRFKKPFPHTLTIITCSKLTSCSQIESIASVA